MKRLSLLTTLLLTSSMVYADWIRHDYNPETVAYTSIPNYSCLEMICEHGCSENTETGEGICCPEPSMESCVSEQFDEFNCPLCKCQEGYEFWQGKCVEKCADKYGLTGKRDEYGNCLCTPGMEGCCPQNTYYSESSDTGCTCLPCPTFDTSGWEKYCSTECKFTPDDPDGCCKMVVVDGVENCLELANSGLEKALLKLGHLDGKYKITYIAGGIKLGRFKDQQYRWHVPGFIFSKNGQTIQTLPQTNKTYTNIEELENNFNSKSVELVCQKDFNYGLYMRDGNIWSSVCGVGLGCTDNCGQIKYLFEKISECPANSSKTKTDQPIGTTACYCKEGYFATQEGYCSTCPDEFSQEMTKTADHTKTYLKYTWTNPYQCDYDVYFNSGSYITVEKDCKGSKDGGDERLTLLIGDTYVYNNSKTICPRYDGEKVGTVYHNTNNTIYIQGENPGGHKGFSINATFKRKK